MARWASWAVCLRQELVELGSKTGVRPLPPAHIAAIGSRAEKLAIRCRQSRSYFFFADFAGFFAAGFLADLAVFLAAAFMVVPLSLFLARIIRVIAKYRVPRDDSSSARYFLLYYRKVLINCYTLRHSSL